MKGLDTSLGGDGRRFPSTRPDWVARFQDPSRSDYRTALEDLCRCYWKPVYTYARLSWAQSNEDAKDLTQAFFAWLLEGEPLKAYQPERGGFRPFLKTLLSRFAGHRHETSQRLKRGGGKLPLRLDDDPALEASVAASRFDAPADAFDRQWLEELLKVAVERVRTSFHAERRDVQFRVFEEHDLSRTEPPPEYKDLAGRLNLRESQVRDYLATVRRAVRREVRVELERMTPDDQDLEAEWKALFAE